MCNREPEALRYFKGQASVESPQVEGNTARDRLAAGE